MDAPQKCRLLAESVVVMNTLNETLIMLLGLFIRLIVPILLTVIVVAMLRKLDVRWQKEAKSEVNKLSNENTPCWKEKGLSSEEISMNAANTEPPCWQAQRHSNGYLREDCLDCIVFLSSPIPEAKHETVHV